MQPSDRGRKRTLYRGSYREDGERIEVNQKAVYLYKEFKKKFNKE